jgi:hypothetical protein
VRAVRNIERFKADLEQGLGVYRRARKERDLSTRQKALVVQLLALQTLAGALLNDGALELLEPMRDLCKGLGDLAEGRRSELLVPAPRGGKRRDTIADVQQWLRAAAAMHFLVPLKGKDKASEEVARWLRLDGKAAKTIDYWRDLGMNGSNDAVKEQFKLICTAWNAKIRDPERRAKALIDAHKRERRAHRESFLGRG